ncbi:MAG: hypothetical protein VX252_06600, partial [Myxococcota bacterium]|nr:hypothetical protein [Myxococcota bacterium]
MRKISFLLLALGLFLASPAMAQPAPTAANSSADAGTAAPADTADENTPAEVDKANEKPAENAEAKAPAEGEKADVEAGVPGEAEKADAEAKVPADSKKADVEAKVPADSEKADVETKVPAEGEKADAKAAEKKKPAKFEWKTSGMIKVADEFVAAIGNKKYDDAYAMGGEILRKERTLETFMADMKKWGFDKPGSVKWDKGNNALPVNNGFKLMGTYTSTDGSSFKVYMHLEGDAHVD